MNESINESMKGYSTLDPVSTAMGDRPQEDKTPRFVTSHSGQLSLLPSADRKMSTGQSGMMLCDWQSRQVWLIPPVDKRVGGR